ncbi:MAG: sulfate ABC transporter substrate-binding protein [Candidatus Margulisbacteria bacterium]|nr:sulfate ABC transporter substrate-binding protein [Candidatus Margulisiibacteriota bacterium]
MGFFGVSLSYAQSTILNVSYDPTREFYKDYNKLFQAHWKKVSGQTVNVRQSHGGSGKQGRSIIDGLEADVATLALGYDIDSLYDQRHLIPQNWQKRLPNNSSPYTSTIVFVVRKGNPKHVRDWDDLVRPGIVVITPNPKTSGGARWNYLAAWGYALKKWKSEPKAKVFVKALYKNIPVLDSGARGSTTTFSERKLGDVLVAWENEAYLLINELGSDKYEIVVPSISIVAEPPVTVVDKNVDKHNTRKVSEAYLTYLYSKEGQELAVKHYFRPQDKKIAAKYSGKFRSIKLFKIESLFGSWQKAQKTHFSDNGVFDQIYAK